MANVLVVDDSDVDRLLMEGLLGHAPGFVVIAAENGEQALKKLEEWSIDIILTDLQMPKMDGLELVKNIRSSSLEVPVILTTGNGSEDIAAKALRAGASGYIPKNKLNQMLVSTIKEVLEIFNGEHSSSLLLECSRVSHYEFELGNDPRLIPLVVNFCEKMLESFAQLNRIDSLRIAVAVDQALQNAMYRGNLELDSEYKIPSFHSDDASTARYVQERFGESPYKDRKIDCVIEIKPSGFAMRISDDGPGFDSSGIDDWNDTSLRGTKLMKAFMDKVRYNDKGNVVKLAYGFDRAKVHAKKMRRARKAAARSVGRITCDVTGEVYEITDRKFVIGRRSACHLRLNGSKVAPLHCMLVNEDDHIMLLNLTPEFSTLVNGTASNGINLKGGDKIQIGEQSFLFEAVS
jgi:CheY-like chemotaxis protein